jgi:hypothetical protein
VITPDSGLLAQEVAIWEATVVDPSASPTDEIEVAEVAWWTAHELDTAIRTGRIDDGFTIAAWCLHSLAKNAGPPSGADSPGRNLH